MEIAEMWHVRPWALADELGFSGSELSPDLWVFRAREWADAKARRLNRPPKGKPQTQQRGGTHKRRVI